jgi:hypothetical protein
MTSTLVAKSDHDGTVYFQDTTGSGSYSVDGFNSACTISGSGTFDQGDISIGLWMDPATGTYDWDWIGLYLVPNVWHCPDADYERSTPVDAKEMVEDLTFDPDDTTTLTGHRVIAADNDLTHDYSWTLTPAP